MILLNENGLKNSSSRLLLYQALQEELFSVIEFLNRPKVTPCNQELYETLRFFSVESPRKWVLEFRRPETQPGFTERGIKAEDIPKLGNSILSLEKWKDQRISKVIDGIKLNPLFDWAVFFRLSTFEVSHEKWNLLGSKRVKLIYQDKIGAWVSDVGSEFYPSLIFSCSPQGVALISPTPLDSAFYLSVSASGILSVISCTFDFLRPTRFVFSHFQSIKRSIS